MSFGVLRKSLIGFRRSEGGAVALLLAAAMLPMVLTAGLAIDGGRAYLVQNRMAKALDAGALAAARVADTDRAEADARRYFDINFPDGYLGANITDFDYALDEDGDFVTVTATADVPTFLMHLAGFDQIPVGESAVVERMNTGLEVALVMDNTGSMGTSNMNAMKSAARHLVDVLFDGEETSPHLWVSLIPYTATVNIGAGRTGWIDASDPVHDPDGVADFYGSGVAWRGCVKARAAPQDETDDPPSDGAFESFYWPPTRLFERDASSDPEVCGSRASVCEPDDDSCEPDYACYFLEHDPPFDNYYRPGALWDSGDSTLENVLAGAINQSQSRGNDGAGPNLGCGPAITSLTNDHATVTAAIDAMLHWSRGGTTSNLGMIWGWRTISPRWNGLWGGHTPDEYPLPYDEPLMDKAVVLLTDGNNQFYDWPGPNDNDSNSVPSEFRDSDGPKYKKKSDGPRGSDVTAYGREEDFLDAYAGGADGYSTVDILNERLKRTCKRMRDLGVIIYTIPFDAPNAAKPVFAACAGDPENYFDAPTPAQLDDAFEAIGQRLSNLRVVR
jgi:Flp pilus assembly protein TadG